MDKLQRTKLLAVVLAAVVICCVFAACKKDPVDDISSTEGSSRSAWLDETAGTEETPPTEIVTDESGETKVVEYETDAQGEIATEVDGKKVTKAASSGGKEDPATPVNGNTTTTTTEANGNTTTTTTRPHTTTTTTRPHTITTTTTTQPALSPTPAELTAAQKQAMVDELFNYAKQLGFPQVTKSQLGEGVTNDFWDVTPSNIDIVMDDFKEMLDYDRNESRFEKTKVTVFWGKEHPNRLFVFTR